MTKDEILAKSREENRNTDFAEIELNTKAGFAGTVASLILCFIIFVTKILIGLGTDYSIYAIIMLNAGAAGMYKFFKTKDKKYLPIGLSWSVIGIMAAVAGILQLFKSASIL